MGSLEKEDHDHGYLRNAITAEVNNNGIATEVKSSDSKDDDDSSGEASGDDENDDNEIKPEDIVEQEVPKKKKKKNLNSLVKPINTKNTNAAAVPPAPGIPNPYGAASEAPPAFAPPAYAQAVAAPAPPTIAAAAPIV